MASLGDSLRVKAAGTKGPAVVGPRSPNEPEMVLQEGKSGGIAKSLQVKNAGSTPLATNAATDHFTKSLGVSTQSSKTVGYF